MKTGILKVLLVLAAVAVLYRLLTGRNLHALAAGRSRGTPAPFDGEWYDDDADGGDDDDAEEYDTEEDEDEEAFDDDTTEAFGSPTAADANGVGGLMNVSADLLPKPSTHAPASFGEFAPSALRGQSFIDASKFVGVNTQGSSLRNANRDLRSAPVIPKQAVGPWSQSTIEADLLRKPLE